MVLALRNPIRQEVDTLSDWMTRPGMGNVYLTGPDRHIWSDPDYFEDLASLEPENPDSIMTSGLTLRLIRVYNDIIGRHIHVRRSLFLSGSQS